MSIAEKFEVIADEVYEKGKKDEYDKFWDVYQNGGNRTNYASAFSQGGFNFRNFYPKYDINIVGSGALAFYNWKNYGETFARGSLKQRLEECGVNLNTSQATNLTNCFAYGVFTEIPTVDLSNVTSADNIFGYNYSSLKTIEKIIMSEDTVISDSWFHSVGGLENLVIEGTIAKNNFNVQWCTKLSSASIVSIIEALSETTSGLTVTLSQTAVNNMVFPIVGNKGTYNSWTELEQSKTNWTISLL